MKLKINLPFVENRIEYIIWMTINVFAYAVVLFVLIGGVIYIMDLALKGM
jgi:hypothetical protein